MSNIGYFVIFFILGAVLVHRMVPNLKNKNIYQKTSSSSIPTPTIFLSPTPTNTNPTIKIYPTPTLMISDQPTTAPKNNSSPDSNSWIYPGSKILSNTGQEIILVSSDNSDAITGWYKNMINSRKASIKTFITTTANGKVSNVLKGSGNGIEISVEISKDQSDSQTRIVIRT